MRGAALGFTELGISRRRVALVHGLILAMVAGSAFCIVTDTEYWPFSQYPMYSNIERPGPFWFLTLWGVPADGGKPEISITDDEYIMPFDWVRLNRAFARLEEMPGHQEKMEAALRDCWARYDRLRASGRHHSPPLQGIRLYRYSWNNVDPSAKLTQPDHRELIAEVMGRDGHTGQ